MRLLRVLVALVALTACSGGTTSSSSSSSSSSSGAPSGVTHHYDSAPPMTIDASKTYVATIAMAKGSIVLTLDAKAAPITVNNFVFLARNGFYDGLKFHRVEPSFVIQTGDPEGSGRGGPGYTIPLEKSGLLHVDGALAMARKDDPDTAGSQFYITQGAQPALDGKYAVFGAVTAGKDVVAKVAVGDVMDRVTIEER